MLQSGFPRQPFSWFLPYNLRAFACRMGMRLAIQSSFNLTKSHWDFSMWLQKIYNTSREINTYSTGHITISILYIMKAEDMSRLQMFPKYFCSSFLEAHSYLLCTLNILVWAVVGMLRSDRNIPVDWDELDSWKPITRIANVGPDRLISHICAPLTHKYLTPYLTWFLPD